MTIPARDAAENSVGKFVKKLLTASPNAGTRGIYSVCSANRYVIEAVLEAEKGREGPVLIEATANQCNQFGGYTGMRPEDFAAFVYEAAARVGFERARLSLGGDHAGPVAWQDEPEAGAMSKAAGLVKEFVLAGFTKIHLDTSMSLAGDAALPDEVIAARTVRLAQICESAFWQRKESYPQSPAPVYVVGSEVPAPGGIRHSGGGLAVTTPRQFADTWEAFRKAFHQAGLQDAFERVIAAVVQPGVEFGDGFIREYDRAAAKDLTAKLREYPGIVFEGHSTDYQTKAKLREMVEDGVAILKVGPALTFHFREAVFALSGVEKELGVPEPSRVKEILDSAMLRNPHYWKKHYRGTEAETAFKRKYSFSDMCRYYFSEADVRGALTKLIRNVDSARAPLSLISQYLPTVYARLRREDFAPTAENFIKARIKDCVDDYIYATRGIAPGPDSASRGTAPRGRSKRK